MKTMLPTNLLLMLALELLAGVAGLTPKPLAPEAQMALAVSRPGRVVLHVLCASRDHRYAWHWRGVLREFGWTN